MPWNALEPETNPPGRGAADLTIATQPVVHLQGAYWMIGGTKGTLRTAGHTKIRYDTFDAARAADFR